MAHAGPAGQGTGSQLADDISSSRVRIDELDAAIIDMLRERRELAAGIQRLRLDSGGVRRELAREMEIVRRYHSAFGSVGPVVASAVLEICRGTP